jgi:hydrogenase/urease accessory protein HupE
MNLFIFTINLRSFFRVCALCLVFFSAFLVNQETYAHGITVGDKGYIQESYGVLFFPFVYLGAKHMVTGYDHLLFILGVIFFLYKRKDVGIYVSLFALGHIITLIGGVYLDIAVNAFMIDAIIGLSVVYKGLDNIGAFQRWLGYQPNTKVATMVFGLFHGFGLATKLQEYELAPEGLFLNLLSFNIGVEIGQILALTIILIAMNYWRKTSSFWNYAYTANVALMTAGFVLFGYQVTGFFVNIF